MPYKDKEAQKEYQRQWVAKRREDFFSDKSCVTCGSTERLELDHVDRSTKITHRIWNWSAERRETELAKCQVLCYNCHRQKTWTVDIPDYLGTDIRQHGTVSMYRHHECRCDKCKAAHSNAQQRWRSK